MKLAMVAADFTPATQQLRKAMATFQRRGTIRRLERKMITRMVRRGYDRSFAERCFNQIKGFGEYGFPESHAASFAHLVYVSAWIKCRYPAAFAAGLLNSQPMGFYAPAQIVRDAREHGVDVSPPDVNRSDYDATLTGAGSAPVLQLGLRSVDGLKEADARLVATRRGGSPMARWPSSGSAPASPSIRSRRWRRPMSSARSTSTGARPVAGGAGAGPAVAAVCGAGDRGPRS